MGRSNYTLIRKERYAAMTALRGGKATIQGESHTLHEPRYLIDKNTGELVSRPPTPTWWREWNNSQPRANAEAGEGSAMSPRSASASHKLRIGGSEDGCASGMRKAGNDPLPVR